MRANWPGEPERKWSLKNWHKQGSQALNYQCPGAVTACVLDVFSRELFNQAKQDVRLKILEYLKKYPLMYEQVVPILTKALDDKDWTIRTEAAKTLGEFGPNAVSALNRLHSLAKEDNPEDTNNISGNPITDKAHRAAEKAIAKIEPKI